MRFHVSHNRLPRPTQPRSHCLPVGGFESDDTPRRRTRSPAILAAPTTWLCCGFSVRSGRLVLVTCMRLACKFLRRVRLYLLLCIDSFQVRSVGPELSGRVGDEQDHRRCSLHGRAGPPAQEQLRDTARRRGGPGVPGCGGACAARCGQAQEASPAAAMFSWLASRCVQRGTAQHSTAGAPSRY